MFSFWVMGQNVKGHWPFANAFKFRTWLGHWQLKKTPKLSQMIHQIYQSCTTYRFRSVPQSTDQSRNTRIPCHSRRFSYNCLGRKVPYCMGYLLNVHNELLCDIHHIHTCVIGNCNIALLTNPSRSWSIVQYCVIMMTMECAIFRRKINQHSKHFKLHSTCTCSIFRYCCCIRSCFRYCYTCGLDGVTPFTHLRAPWLCYFTGDMNRSSLIK